MARLTARFSVTGWDEQPLEGIDGDWVGAVRMSKTFSTGLIGTSTALFASSGPVEGHRAYVAIERIEGSTDDGRTGCVTVHHGGLESDPRTWRPVCPHLLHNELEAGVWRPVCPHLLRNELETAVRRPVCPHLLHNELHACVRPQPEIVQQAAARSSEQQLHLYGTVRALEHTDTVAGRRGSG